MRHAGSIGWRSIVPLALTLSLAACVGAPARHEPEVDVTPPEEWTAVEGDPADVREEWWREFDDPRLNQLIEIALERNNDLHAAAARVAQAVERAKIAGADLKPTVSVGVNASRRQQNFVGLPIPGDAGGVLTSTSTQLGASVDIAWEADLWGRLRAGARASLADMQATEAVYRGARQSIAAQTAKIWFAVAEAGEQAELARRSAESFRVSAEQIRTRFIAGVRPALDVRLALSNYAAAEAQYDVRARQLDALVRQLEVLLGDYPAADLLEDFPADTLPDTPPPVPTGLPAQLVARRPDLVAAERQLAAADQRYIAARRSLYPRLTLTASGGTVSQQFADLLDGDFKVWSIAGGLLQPVFQGGRLRAQVRLTDASADELLALYAGAVLDAFAEVETALASEQHLARQEEHLADSARQLVAAERLAGDRYANGISGYLEVLDSQTRSFIARSNLLSLRRERLANRVDLHLALGGGFEDTTDDPSTVAVATQDDPS